MIDGLLDLIIEDIFVDVILIVFVYKCYINDFWCNYFSMIKELINYDMMQYVFMKF